MTDKVSIKMIFGYESIEFCLSCIIVSNNICKYTTLVGIMQIL